MFWLFSLTQVIVSYYLFVIIFLVGKQFYAHNEMNDGIKPIQIYSVWIPDTSIDYRQGISMQKRVFIWPTCCAHCQNKWTVTIDRRITIKYVCIRCYDFVTHVAYTSLWKCW